METHTVLDVAVTNQLVFFEVKENESAEIESLASGVTNRAEGGMPSEE